MKMVELLKSLDEFLQELDIKKKIFIYATPFIVGLLILVFFILPIQNNEIEELKIEKEKLQNRLKKDRVSKIKAKIQSTQKQIFQLKESIEEDKDSLNYFYARLSNLDIIKFDEEKWLLVLNDILKKSALLNISIDVIKNSDPKIKDLTNQIVAKKYVEIVGSGDYKSILKYIDFIENSRYLAEIKNIKVYKSSSLDKKVEFKINFTIYGVNI